MSRKPRIPMLPTEVPQQRLYLVKGLPERPANWSITFGTDAEKLAPAAMPRSARYIAQVEWAWLPMHMRIDAYYLSMCTHHRCWVLWSKGYDDNWSRWMDPAPAAIAPRSGLNAEAAARLLLHDHWVQERDGGLDRFHWVNEGGSLEAGAIVELAAWVWDRGRSNAGGGDAVD